jgi:hypothetical protein
MLPPMAPVEVRAMFIVGDIIICRRPVIRTSSLDRMD